MKIKKSEKKKEYYTLVFALGKAINQAKEASLGTDHRVFRSVKLKDKAFSEAGFTVNSDGNISMVSVKISFDDLISEKWEIVE